MNRREFAGGLAVFVAALKAKLPELARTEAAVPVATVEQAVGKETEGPILLPLDGLIECQIHYGLPVDITSMYDSSRQFMRPLRGSETLELTFQVPYPLWFDKFDFDRAVLVDLRHPPAGLDMVMTGMVVKYQLDPGARVLTIYPTGPVVWT